MSKSYRSFFYIMLFAFAGCVAGESPKGRPLVSGNPFGAAPETVKASVPKPSTEVAALVDKLGREMVASNRQVGLNPLFFTIGTPTNGKPTVEIFHLDTRAVYVTEGLVKMCASNEQLAAVLAMELGKMAAERTQLALTGPDHGPPPEAPSGKESGPNLTQLFELASYQKERKERAEVRADPRSIATGYLEKIKLDKTLLDQAAPILVEAARNCTFEKQFTGMPAGSGAK